MNRFQNAVRKYKIVQFYITLYPSDAILSNANITVYDFAIPSDEEVLSNTVFFFAQSNPYCCFCKAILVIVYKQVNF